MKVRERYWRLPRRRQWRTWKIRLLLAVTGIVLLTACANESAEFGPCSITADAVSFVDAMKVESATYYLVYRVSGWSDKTEILELYDSQPVFDRCSNSDREPVFADSLELSRKVEHVYLNLNEKTLDIEYSDRVSDISDDSGFAIELRVEDVRKGPN